ncbi:MAG: lipid-A-disaccharide synthase [Xanthobacteraceae bacterium]
MTAPPPGKTVFLVATEESGDRLGAALMRALQQRFGGALQFTGVGGRAMAAEGLASRFAIEELSIVGLAAVARRLSPILRRIRETADAAVAAEPAVVVLIDSPDFNLRVGRRIRAQAPAIPIIDYVSPTVWAWRPGRAKAMRGFVDHVLALLPFEPAVHDRLGGPPCTYVGHPLLEQVGRLRPDATEAARRDAAPPVLLALPGSRRSEIRHHMSVFGEALGRLAAQGTAFDLIVPTMPHLVDAVTEAAAAWPVAPRIVVGENEKRAAFRIAHAALAKSGTVTLELALAGVPMVAAYKAGAVEAWLIRKVIRSDTVILANLVLGDNVVPEFIQDDCTADNLVAALAEVMADTPSRRRQVEAFAGIDTVMAIGDRLPSEAAADIVVAHMR